MSPIAIIVFKYMVLLAVALTVDISSISGRRRQDPAHLYYVHFAASSDGVHNVIALVNGADRVKINSEPEG